MLMDFTKIAFDILIHAGQSNAEGFGFGDVAQPYMYCDKVWYLNANPVPGVCPDDCVITYAHEVTHGSEMIGNFALPFARAYVDSGHLAEGRQLLIVRAAVGGTGFVDGFWTPQGKLNLRMLDMIRIALALNPENRLVALLWHQGENEYTFGGTQEGHYQNLMTFVTGVRQEFGCPNLPFIAADFVQDWKKLIEGKAEPIVDAIRAVCQDCGQGRFVETDGLKSNFEENGRIVRWEGWEEDHIHFSRSALYELGTRYFSAYEKIVKSEPNGHT